MDDLKNIVIQNLEQEGTLGSLRAQLRAQVFKAIENYADSNTKQSAGFQWQNPVASKIHEDPDSKIMALLIKEYLEHYKMDYTLSVYLPEIAMQGSQHQVSREELVDKAGLTNKAAAASADQPPLLVQLLKQMREQPAAGASAGSSPGKSADMKMVSAPAASKLQTEEVKTVSNTSKSPFRSSVQSAGQPMSKSAQQSPGGKDDDIEEDIIQDPEDIQLHSARDHIAASGGASSAVGIDQSIDTLKLDEFDWVEDVKHTPRGEI